MTVPPSNPPAARGFPVGKVVLGFLAGLVLVLAFGAGALLAYQGQYADRIYPGVTADGIDVSGLSREAATARLRDQLARYSGGTVVLTIDGSQIRIPYAALGRRADVDTLVELAWSVGRGHDDMLGGAAQGVRRLLDGTRIAPAVVVDPEAVGRALATVASAVDRQPVGGTATATPAGFTTTPAVPGKSLPRTEIASALVTQLSDPAAPDTLELSFGSVATAPDVDDSDVATAIEVAKRMTQPVVLVHGKESWTLGAEIVRGWISFEATADGYRPTVSATAPTKALTTLAGAVNKAPKEASFVVSRGDAVAVNPGRNGRVLDVTTSAPLVAQAVVDRAAGTGKPARVALAITAVEPKLTTEEAKKAAPRMRKISSWTTYYEVSERNGFSNNISIPARDIDGTVVAPGAIFDFWHSIGPVTYARGYRDGGAIINGHSQPTGALGGGICSTSTTLFNAVARAGYKMLARHNHYYYITRYPTGLDATVAITDGFPTTMSWKNDSQYPVLIRSYARPGVVSFSVYTVAVNGRPAVGGGARVPGPTNVTYRVANGRTVTFATSAKRNYNSATSSVVRTTALAPGHVKIVEFPDDGFDITVVRTVSENGKRLYVNTWFSHYARVNGLTLIGAKKS